MFSNVTLLPRFLRGQDSAVLGDCIVCAEAVRERDDRMRLHGRYVHTACAGYRLAASRARAWSGHSPLTRSSPAINEARRTLA